MDNSLFISTDNGSAVPMAEIPALEEALFRDVLIRKVREENRQVLSFFALPENDGFKLICILGSPQDHCFEVTSGSVGKSFMSMSSEAPAFQLFEREIAEQYGLEIKDHPWLKPVRDPEKTGFFKMSGDAVWVSGLGENADQMVQGFTGATPLAAPTMDGLANAGVVFNEAGEVVAGNGYSVCDMIIGTIPGSVGETSVIAILLGAILLLWTGVASWKIMVSSVIGGLAIGYLGQESLFQGPDFGYDRFNARLNVSHKMSDRLTVSLTSSFIRNNIKDHAYWTEWIIEQCNRMPSIYEIKNPDGTYTYPSGSNSNSLERLEKGGYRRSVNDDMSGTITAEYKIVDGLKAIVSGGGRILNNQTHENRYASENPLSGDKEDHISESFNRSTKLTANAMLSYDKTFAELGSDIKNTISHRARAVEKLCQFLKA